ncbi:muconolactone Delta-isomerase family protein [Phaeacidiphilus oryzae]|jgi:muconolactone delta-isomerase|uniref:muconolactone Delta-isomerase family protein n=1 Tax=Phaeacidiphilus oryzae TaxID=348818 RepID=UPI000564A48A|nr:muconolactone Delta-isomerase family protein [Phaeacidiphilus oryzae]
MEYLVTMVTTVPAGTTEQEVEDVRAREAANSRRLAQENELLRLWRPPLGPGEWRSLGLFSAPDAERLEETLAAMPLRVWRRDEVTALTPHPNDPGPAGPTGPARPAAGPRLKGSAEFFVVFAPKDPAPAQGPSAESALQEATAAEAVRARELAAAGHLVRLWRLPDGDRALGLWRAADAEEIRGILGDLPLAPRLTTEVTPLSEHPNDPRPAHD